MRISLDVAVFVQISTGCFMEYNWREWDFISGFHMGQSHVLAARRSVLGNHSWRTLPEWANFVSVMGL